MPNKVVMLGLDACDVQLVKDWVAQGELSYFNKLMNQTTMMEVSSSCEVMSGSIWPSFFTSKTPDHHGMFYMLQMDNDAYNIKKTHAKDLQSEPFWSALADDKRCTIIDLPKLGLVEKGDNVQVVEWGAADHYSQFQTHPSSLANLLTERFGPHVLHKEFVEPTSVEDYQSLFKALCEDLESKIAMCEYLLQQNQPDLFIAVLGETHSAGHYFWRFHAPEKDEVIPIDIQKPLLKLYKKLDACLQKFEQSLGENTNLFIFSGHGMVADNYPRWILNVVLEKMGVLHTLNKSKHMGNAGPVKHKESSWLDKKIEITRQYINQHFIPKRLQTKLWLSKIQRDIDFKKSQAWAMPSDLQGCIRINLEGREPTGTVKKSEYKQTIEQIIAVLKSLKNTETGAPIVDKIFKLRDIYADGNHTESLPDISVLWSNQNVEHIYSDLLGEIPIPNAARIRSGNHRPYGFCFAKGPDINHQHTCGQIDLMDLGPTVLKLIEPELKLSFTGTPLPIINLSNLFLYQIIVF
jgi:predicted AlkP superfamily phosphohydrolase/phosphomutase